MSRQEAVVVIGRLAGAATALLLARADLRGSQVSCVQKPTDSGASRIGYRRRRR